MASSKKIAVLDFETDPFKHGRLPEPFAWGFYDGVKYVSHWEKQAWGNHRCVEKLVAFLDSLEQPHLILAHNGGKFDFIFLLPYLSGNIRLVNGRILEATIGKHTLRDSYGILPIPLSEAGGKLEIDYMLMERDCREDHREEIMHYLSMDCVSLYDLCMAFYDEFGDQLTIGGTAMKQLKKFHPFEKGDEKFDALFRPYYFGGRCQCFETGIIETKIEVFDLNSSYPYTMRDMLHPVSAGYDLGKTITKNTCFIRWYGYNDNAVPTRTKTGLDFTIPRGEFCSTIHEFNAGLETNTIVPEFILETVDFKQLSTFGSYVDHFYTARLAAKADHDLFHSIFYKLILNSAYGKFAQSPENFKDSIILPMGEIPTHPYEIEATANGYAIWSKPSERKTYFNVATAASITGGSRSTLLRGLAQTVRPIYCDTDSIFCESMAGIHDAKALGAWKPDGQGDTIAIAGKKLYALFDGEKCVKKASKGTRLNPLAIAMIARGDMCESRNDAPTFKLDGRHVFIERNIRRTK